LDYTKYSSNIFYDLFYYFQEKPVGYFVLQCKATDSDGPDTALRYSFLATRNPDHAKFRIDPVSGNLTTAAVLDRETQPQYDVSY
jgi:alpha-ketoglutarate-dependent taurine dioxygenase